MISKLAKAHESWGFKIISAAVAVSFVSLFGVTGYIDSAAQNQTVVNVDGLKTTQSEFSYRLQRELGALKNLAGDDFELTDELRNSLAEGILKQIVDDSVLDRTLTDNDIYFPKAFIQQIIFSQPEFKNPAKGQFNPELFRRYLSSANLSEDEYVATVKRLMARKMLVTDLTFPFAVPDVLSKAIHQMDNRRKSFRYILVSPEDVKIERQISDDEIKQYFEDFSETFMIPETRDAEVLFVPNEVILKKYAATEEMIADYYKQHEKEFDQPEKREVQQMVFSDKAQAEKALDSVKAGKDFAAVAKEYNAENADEPSLGVVSQDELAEGLAYEAFGLPVNEPKLLQVADTWQVVSVKKVIPAKKMTLNEVKSQIAEILNNDNLYEALRDARAELDDAVNGGMSIEDVAKLFQTEVLKVSDIQENTVADKIPEQLKPLASSLDFNELLFSYGLNEISSAEEFDNGLAVIRVTAIKDAHLPEIADVKDKIINLWAIQEKDALAKEMAENIIADAENGSQLADAAKARNLEVFRSEPISRNETFADLNGQEISELFLADTGTVKLFEHSGNRFIIATPYETTDFNDELHTDALEEVRNRAKMSMAVDMAKNALSSYAEGMKIEIDYQRAGFSE